MQFANDPLTAKRRRASLSRAWCSLAPLLLTSQVVAESKGHLVNGEKDVKKVICCFSSDKIQKWPTYREKKKSVSA